MMTDHREAAYRIKGAVRRAVTLAGGASFAALDMEISISGLSKCQSPNYPDHLRLDLVPRLEALSGSPIVSETLAGLQGFRLVRGNDIDTGIATLGDLARILSRVGDFSTCFATSLEDQVVDAHERRAINSKIEDLVKELRTVQAKVNGEG